MYWWPCSISSKLSHLLIFNYFSRLFLITLKWADPQHRSLWDSIQVPPPVAVDRYSLRFFNQLSQYSPIYRIQNLSVNPTVAAFHWQSFWESRQTIPHAYWLLWRGVTDLWSIPLFMKSTYFLIPRMSDVSSCALIIFFITISISLPRRDLRLHGL